MTSHRLEKRIAENEAKELKEKQRNMDEKRRQVGCTFEYANFIKRLKLEPISRLSSSRSLATWRVS